MRLLQLLVLWAGILASSTAWAAELDNGAGAAELPAHDERTLRLAGRGRRAADTGYRVAATCKPSSDGLDLSGTAFDH